MAAAPLRRRAPVRQPVPAPARRPGAPTRRPAVAGRTVVVPRGAAVLDRLLSGRLWLGLVFVLLVGIVFFNVDLLRMNRDIAVTAEKAETVKRQNARLRGDLARLGSSERIQKVAAESGLVLPAAGEVRYLKLHPGTDGRDALARLRAGSGLASDTAVPPAQSGQGASGAGEAAVQQNTGAAPAAGTTTTPSPQAATPQGTTPQTAAPATGATAQTPEPQAPASTATGTGQ